ncbi:hypothetical protein DICSQDRAFT_175934 [Dichomitus squalens LYAD-421 SS1]|uniref:Uncharacterized protein n=1 Tax=Dichomitus squalens (strain LYAD-421) TaxID=732165 RepID=R7SI58_DICSQ|nr:uncharacterized protein DICSQDRAFT_175934 [Dichomitus squalens LYAD-421 SS1]EJF55420.1 hypothetical protein DICSQDRAFT_175934 [Dichomitus squalens LYAD-421 SS1]
MPILYGILQRLTARITPFHTYAGYQYSRPCRAVRSKRTPVVWPGSMHKIVASSKPDLKEDGLNDRTLTENTSADGPGIDV